MMSSKSTGSDDSEPDQDLISRVRASNAKCILFNLVSAEGGLSKTRQFSTMKTLKLRQVYYGPRVVNFISAKRKKLVNKNK